MFNIIGVEFLIGYTGSSQTRIELAELVPIHRYPFCRSIFSACFPCIQLEPFEYIFKLSILHFEQHKPLSNLLLRPIRREVLFSLN